MMGRQAIAGSSLDARAVSPLTARADPASLQGGGVRLVMAHTPGPRPGR